MVKIEKYLNWLATIQLVGTIIYFLLNRTGQYIKVIVYFSACVFIGYWLIRIVFASQEELEEKKQNNEQTSDSITELKNVSVIEKEVTNQ